MLPLHAPPAGRFKLRLLSSSGAYVRKRAKRAGRLRCKTKLLEPQGEATPRARDEQLGGRRAGWGPRRLRAVAPAASGGKWARGGNWRFRFPQVALPVCAAIT